MSNKIDTMTQQYLQITGRPAETAPQGRAADHPTSGDKTAPSDTTDKILLTDTARSLQALGQQLAGVDEVDRGRVEAVRERIESGNYEVSPQSVADKMIAMDRALPEDK